MNLTFPTCFFLTTEDRHMRTILAPLFVMLMIMSSGWILYTLIWLGFASDFGISLALGAVVVTPLGLLLAERPFRPTNRSSSVELKVAALDAAWSHVPG
jgi:hypothetical protein